MSVLELFSLAGKTAIVTGGARGIGRQSALALAEAGANVALCDLLEEEGQKTRDQLVKIGRRALFSKINVTHKKDIDSFVQRAVQEFGKIDILINNVGIPSEGRSLEDETDEFWDHILQTNLSSVMYVSRAVARQMIELKQGGVMINIGSISGLIINNISPRHNVPYCVTKAAVLHLTRGMAANWASYGIRANAIAPGYVLTEQTNWMESQPEVGRRLLDNTPMKRFGEVEELKGTVVYLASEASSFINGQVIIVDGGFTIW
jgi:NAD(P)-dependent dehydrogenase (short-subunit alcohol dehydrogenase family)